MPIFSSCRDKKAPTDFPWIGGLRLAAGTKKRGEEANLQGLPALQKQKAAQEVASYLLSLVS